MHWRTSAPTDRARAAAASSSQRFHDAGTWSSSRTIWSARGSGVGGTADSRGGISRTLAPGRGRIYNGGVIATPVLQVTAGVIIALFLIQVARRLTSQSQNPIAVGVNDGLTFLTS